MFPLTKNVQCNGHIYWTLEGKKRLNKGNIKILIHLRHRKCSKQYTSIDKFHYTKLTTFYFCKLGNHFPFLSSSVVFPTVSSWWAKHKLQVKVSALVVYTYNLKEKNEIDFICLYTYKYTFKHAQGRKNSPGMLQIKSHTTNAHSDNIL